MFGVEYNYGHEDLDEDAPAATTKSAELGTTDAESTSLADLPWGMGGAIPADDATSAPLTQEALRGRSSSPRGDGSDSGVGSSRGGSSSSSPSRTESPTRKSPGFFSRIAAWFNGLFGKKQQPPVPLAQPAPGVIPRQAAPAGRRKKRRQIEFDESGRGFDTVDRHAKSKRRLQTSLPDGVDVNEAIATRKQMLAPVTDVHGPAARDRTGAIATAEAASQQRAGQFEREEQLRQAGQISGKLREMEGGFDALPIGLDSERNEHIRARREMLRKLPGTAARTTQTSEQTIGERETDDWKSTSPDTHQEQYVRPIQVEKNQQKFAGLPPQLGKASPLSPAGDLAIQTPAPATKAPDPRWADSSTMSNGWADRRGRNSHTVAQLPHAGTVFTGGLPAINQLSDEALGGDVEQARHEESEASNELNSSELYRHRILSGHQRLVARGQADPDKPPLFPKNPPRTSRIAANPTTAPDFEDRMESDEAVAIRDKATQQEMEHRRKIGKIESSIEVRHRENENLLKERGLWKPDMTKDQVLDKAGDIKQEEYMRDRQRATEQTQFAMKKATKFEEERARQAFDKKIDGLRAKVARGEELTEREQAILGGYKQEGAVAPDDTEKVRAGAVTSFADSHGLGEIAHPLLAGIAFHQAQGDSNAPIDPMSMVPRPQEPGPQISEAEKKAAHEAAKKAEQEAANQRYIDQERAKADPANDHLMDRDEQRRLAQRRVADAQAQQQWQSAKKAHESRGFFSRLFNSGPRNPGPKPKSSFDLSNDA